MIALTRREPHPSTTGYEQECVYYARRERITGIDDPRTVNVLDLNGDLYPYLLNFPVQDSIVYRLYYTLERLYNEDLADNGVDNCGWSAFYDAEGTNIGDLGFDEDETMDAIFWDKIVLAGWSQGAGHAALIGLKRPVGGMFLLEGPSDVCLLDGFAANPERTAVGASYYSALSPQGDPPRFGIYHLDSGGPAWAAEGPDARPVAWDNFTYPLHDEPLGGWFMPQCEDEPWNSSEVEAARTLGGAPRLKVSTFEESGIATYRSMSLETDAIPAGPPGCGAHGSVALGNAGGSCMPDESSPPNMATRADEALWFEAYVGAFCEMGR